MSYIWCTLGVLTCGSVIVCVYVYVSLSVCVHPKETHMQFIK